MNLDPTELRKTLKGLSRRERRSRARQAWDTLELWKDKEYALLSRQQAREQSWKTYWAMWREEYEPPKVISTGSPKVPKKAKGILKKIAGLFK